MTRFRFNLLKNQTFKATILSPVFPYVLQLLALTAFLGLMFNGFSSSDPSGYEAGLTKYLRKTNLSTLAVWGLWWPGLILTTILLGRLWCTMCPMELVSNVTRRLARLIGFKGFILPKWARTGFIILGAYLILQLLVGGFEVHRVPLYTAWVLLALLAMAAFVGWTFREPRAFCHGFCPAALLLDAYSLLTRAGLRAASPAVCADCKTKDCVREASRFRLDARSCPSYLKPYHLTQDDGCVLCFQCAKICPSDNIGVGWLKTEKETKKPLPLPVALFIMIAGGFVSHELFGEVKGLDQIFHAVPQYLASITSLTELFPWFEALWFLLVLPGFLTLTIWSIARMGNHRATFAGIISQSAVGLVPLVAAGHGVKALIKINAWSVYLPSALTDPHGFRLARSLLNKSVTEPNTLISVNLAAFGFALILLGATWLAIRMIQRFSEESVRPAAYAGVTLLTLLFGTVIYALGKG
jgi:polyferredoxin